MDRPQLPDAGRVVVGTLKLLRARLTTDPQGTGLRVTEPVVTAVEEAITAGEAENWPLMAALLAVKSLLCGVLEHDDESAFGEDAEHNKGVRFLGVPASVYSSLDGYHFELALAVGTLPAGMTVMHADGTGRRASYDGDIESDSPTLRQMAAERKEIRRRAAAG